MLEKTHKFRSAATVDIGEIEVEENWAAGGDRRLWGRLQRSSGHPKPGAIDLAPAELLAPSAAERDGLRPLPTLVVVLAVPLDRAASGRAAVRRVSIGGATSVVRDFEDDDLALVLAGLPLRAGPLDGFVA